MMRAGSRAACRTLVVHAHASDSPNPARAGFIVGRAVGGSVVRTRVTRQLRHLMAAYLEDMPTGTDVVVRALPSSATATHSELDRDLASGIRRALTKMGHEAGTAPVMSQ